MKKTSISTVISLILLAGCAAPTAYDRYKSGEVMRNFAYKAGATEARQQRDITDCQISAAQRVPQNLSVQTTPTYTSPTQTYCNRIGTQTFCNTTGGNTYGGQTYTTDTNAGLRVRAYGQCMVDKGYRFVNIPPCPIGTIVADLDKSKVLQPYSRATCYLVTPEGIGAIGNLGG